MINSLSNKKTSYVELIFTNSAVFGATLFLERTLVTTKKKVRLGSRDIIYDRLELLHPGRENELHEDLVGRTGIEPVRVDIKKIDLPNNSASISIRFAKENPKKKAINSPSDTV